MVNLIPTCIVPSQKKDYFRMILLNSVDVFSQVISPVHWFSVFHSTDQLRNTRSDLRSHPVAMLLLLLLRKKRREKAGHTQNLLPVKATSGQDLFRSRDFVISGQKSPLGRIWHHFRLHIRRTYFRSRPLPDRVTSGHVTDVTSGHVTSGCSKASLHRKY